MNYNRNQVDGDLAVRNDAVVGGDSTTRGNQSVMGDLHVAGSIIGSSVSSKDMGLFLTESALKVAVPTPEVGMYAAVGSTFPASLYRCDDAGTWTATGEDVTYTSPTAVALQVIKSVTSALIAVEQTRAEFAEDTLKSLVATETKERKANNEDIAQMLRRLAVFMSDHHHHHLDADWLWKELLLGASLDVDNDILTLMGIKYQLTRYTEVVDVPVITDDGNGVVTITSVSGSVIYYTMDGTTPTDLDTKYESAFTATESCTIKAIAVKDNVSSDVTSHDVTIAPKKVSESWGAIKSAILTYSNNTVASTGGTTSPVPTLEVAQEKIEVWTDGERKSTIDVSDSVTINGFSSSNSIATVDANGNVTFVNANTSTVSTIDTTITASFVVNEKEGTATAVVKESAASAPSYYIGAGTWEGALSSTSLTGNASKSGSVSNPLATVTTSECVMVKCPIEYSISVEYFNGVNTSTATTSDGLTLLNSDDTYNYYGINASGSVPIISVTYTKK